MADDRGFAQLADGREVAYRVMSRSDGPVIVHNPNVSAPIDLLDEDPMYDRFLRTLASAGRLVLYNSLGIGSSDPVDPESDRLGEQNEVYGAVLDAVGAEAAWMVGSTPAVFAETIRAHPDRVSGVVYVSGITRRQWRRSTRAATTGQRKSPAEIANEIYPSRADDPAFLEWLHRTGRLSRSKSASAASMESNRRGLDRFIAEAQPVVAGPPVMLIRRRDAMGAAEFDWWRGIFPDAEYVTIEGADMDIPALDAGLIAELAVGFITGTPVEAPAERKLVAVLFTDLVDSTPAAAASGDTVWRSMLDRYEAALQRTIQHHHGTVVKHTGDGALATFPSGSEAITAAIELRNATRDLGLEGRTGIHVGEVEQRGDDIGGIAVNLAARVMGEAGPGDIVVSAAVAYTTTGGRFSLADLGSRSLKGIEQTWQLFTIESDR